MTGAAKSLTRPVKLLAAAGSLAREGRTEFTAEDLVVRAFELYPDTFALRGYPHFPHSKPVVALLSGKDSPLIARGWLEKTGTQQFRLTPLGSTRLQELDLESGTQVAVQLARKLEGEIGRLLTSRAFELFRDDQQEQITFHQFTRFVGLSARDKWQRVSGQIEKVEHAIAEAMRMGESGDFLRISHGGRNLEFPSDDLRTLSAAYAFMRDRFSEQMESWRQSARTR